MVKEIIYYFKSMLLVVEMFLFGLKMWWIDGWEVGLMIVYMLVYFEMGVYKVIFIGYLMCMMVVFVFMMEVYDLEMGLWMVLGYLLLVGCMFVLLVVLCNGVFYCLMEVLMGLLVFNFVSKVWCWLEIKSYFWVFFFFEYFGYILFVVSMSVCVMSLGIWSLWESFLSVWLKVVVMLVDFVNYFLKSGKL